MARTTRHPVERHLPPVGRSSVVYARRGSGTKVPKNPTAASRRATLQRAIDRGELALDAELALDLLAGPLLTRDVLTGEQFDDDYARRLVEAVLRTLPVVQGA
jgi:hypothetical protein